MKWRNAFALMTLTLELQYNYAFAFVLLKALQIVCCRSMSSQSREHDKGFKTKSYMPPSTKSSTSRKEKQCHTAPKRSNRAQVTLAAKSNIETLSALLLMLIWRKMGSTPETDPQTSTVLLSRQKPRAVVLVRSRPRARAGRSFLPCNQESKRAARHNQWASERAKISHSGGGGGGVAHN